MKGHFFKNIFKFFLVLIFLIIGCILYSHYLGTKGIYVKEYKITNDQIEENFHGLKIVHFSDLHFGTSTNLNDLNKIVKNINLLKPDIVVFTGDLFDKSIPLNEKEITKIMHALTKIEATLGKYAIQGEMDYKSNDWETIMTGSNFVNLNDTFDYIYKENNTPLIISGLSSNLKNKKNIEEKLETSTNEILQYNQNHEKPIYSILLLHEPDYINQINVENYQLILAGHSHAGQINIPVIQKFFLPKGSTQYYHDFYKIKNSDFYISSGIGTTEFTYRFRDRPSINFYRLTNK